MTPDSSTTDDVDALRVANGLTAILLRRDGTGALEHSQDDVLNAMPWLVMLGQQLDPHRQPSPSVERLMTSFALHVGISPTDTPADVSTKVAAYYAANPVKPDLVHAVGELLGRELGADFTTEAARGYAERLLPKQDHVPIAQAEVWGAKGGK
jgi:hypothetical protein